MNVWAPGRGALEVQLTTLLAVIGAILVLRSVCAPTPGVTTYRKADRATAWGVALSLMKPQFGTTAVIGLAAGRFRGVAWGVAGLALTSLPMLIVCTAAAGGPVEFVGSVRRDLAVATSDHHPSGLMFPDQRRLDLLGQIVRWGTGVPPRWVQIAVPILFLVVLPIVVVRLTRRPLAVSVVTCSATLLGIYHGTYDVLILLIPVAVGFGMAVHGELTRAGDRIALVACLLVVLHLQTVSTTIVPGLGYRGADAVNLFLMLVGLIAGLYTAIVSRRSEEILHSDVRTGSTAASSSALSS